MKIRTVTITIKGDDLKAVEALEERFSDALSDRIAQLGAVPRHDKDGDMTGVCDVWGCTVEVAD